MKVGRADMVTGVDLSAWAESSNAGIGQVAEAVIMRLSV